MINAGYKEIDQLNCPVKSPIHKCLFFRKEFETLPFYRYAIVTPKGHFVNWESSREDEIAQKKVNHLVFS